MKRQTIEELEQEAITLANNSTSDPQGNVTTTTETTKVTETVTQTNSTTTNSTIANDDINTTAITYGSDGTILDPDEIVKTTD